MLVLVKYAKKHKSGRVEYRRAFPVSLLPFIPGKEGQLWAEHKVSLGRFEEPQFRKRYDEAAEAYRVIVSRAERLKAGTFDVLDGALVAYLADCYHWEVLADDDTARWSFTERGLPRAIAEDLEKRGIPPDWAGRGQESAWWARKNRVTAEAMLVQYRILKAEGDIERLSATWMEDALDLAEARGLVIDESDQMGLMRLCRALNDAAINAAEEKLRRSIGDEVPTPTEPVSPKEAKGAAGQPLSLLATFDAYAAEAGVAPSIRSEWRSALVKLTDFLGHDDAAQLTADDVVRWKEHLAGETTRTGEKRAARTVNNKYLTPLRTALGWAVDNRKLKENVAAGVKVRLPKTAKLRDRDFTPEEYRAILSATLKPASAAMSEGHRLARRWVPWLCAYTGARVNEMSQLRGQDVQEIEGVWTLRITPEAGRVKGREARIVPMHPHIIEQGFLKVVGPLGDGPLFYDPARRRVEGDSNRHFKKVGERLAEWVRKDVGVTDPSIQPNHAWRHTFKTRATDSGMQEHVSDAITGHAATTVGRSYGRVSLQAKAEAIHAMPHFDVNAGPF